LTPPSSPAVLRSPALTPRYLSVFFSSPTRPQFPLNLAYFIYLLHRFSSHKWNSRSFFVFDQCPRVLFYLSFLPGRSPFRFPRNGSLVWLRAPVSSRVKRSLALPRTEVYWRFHEIQEGFFYEFLFYPAGHTIYQCPGREVCDALSFLMFFAVASCVGRTPGGRWARLGPPLNYSLMRSDWPCDPLPSTPMHHPFLTLSCWAPALATILSSDQLSPPPLHPRSTRFFWFATTQRGPSCDAPRLLSQRLPQ